MPPAENGVVFIGTPHDRQDHTRMKNESIHPAFLDTQSRTLLQRLRRWWRSRDADDRYLAGAADLADLERRMRVVERASGGPAFVTFNH